MTLTTGTVTGAASINCPVNTSVGDLITVDALSNHGGDTTLPTAPTGFSTADVNTRAGGTNISLGVFYKIADGTETTSTVFTVGDFTDGTRRLACTVRSKETDKDWTFVGTTTGNGTNTAHVMTGIETTNAPVFYMAALAAGANGGSAYTSSVFTELVDYTGAGSVAYWDDPTAATIGTTCTTVNSVDAGWILAAFEAVAVDTGLVESIPATMFIGGVPSSPFTSPPTVPNVAVQRGTTLLTSGSTSETETITTVGGLDKAYVRVTNVANATRGDGSTAGERSRDMGVAVYLSDTSTITFVRGGNAAAVTVYWEVVEYVGPAGGPNEWTVLHQAVETLTSTSTTFTMDTAAAALADVVVDVGSVHADEYSQHNRQFVQGRRVSTTQFKLDSYTENSQKVGVIVVGYNGSAWTVGADEFTTNNTTTEETHTLTTAVADWSKTMLVSSYRAASSTNTMNKMMAIVWPSTTSTIKTKLADSSVQIPWSIFTIEHADLVVIHDDSIDGTLAQYASGSTAKTYTVDAVTLTEASVRAGLSVNDGGSDTAEYWLDYWLATTTTVNFAGAFATGVTAHIALQVIDWTAVTSSGIFPPNAAPALTNPTQIAHTLQVWTLDEDLHRIQLVTGYKSIKAVARHRRAGSWVIEGADNIGALTAGRRAGIELVVDGYTFIAGPVGPIFRNTVKGVLTYTLSGVSYEALEARNAVPDPTIDQGPYQTTHYQASGTPATVAAQLLADYWGTNASNARQYPGLTVDTPAIVGPNISVQLRFVQVMPAVEKILAEYGLGIRIAITEDPATLTASIIADNPSQVVWSDQHNTIGDSVVGSLPPAATHAMIGGQGEGTARNLVEQTSTDAIAYGRRETFVDRRDLDDDLLLLEQSATTLDARSASTTIAAPLIERPSLRWRDDWELGDIVTAAVDGIEVTQPIHEIGLNAIAGTVTLTPVVGNKATTQLQIFDDLKTIREQLNALEGSP